MPVPDTPEHDLGLAQFIEIQRMPALGWGYFGQAPKVFGKKFSYLPSPKVVDFDRQFRGVHRCEDLTEIMERLTPILPAGVSRERPRAARNSRTRAAMRWFRSEDASFMLVVFPNIGAARQLF